MESKNGLISRMLFSDLYRIMVIKVIFVGVRGAISPLDLPLIRSQCLASWTYVAGKQATVTGQAEIFPRNVQNVDETPFQSSGVSEPAVWAAIVKEGARI